MGNWWSPDRIRKQQEMLEEGKMDEDGDEKQEDVGAGAEGEGARKKAAEGDRGAKGKKMRMRKSYQKSELF